MFGAAQIDKIASILTLACLGAFIAFLINAGLLKNWFQPSFTLRILLPDEGVSGLSSGAEVQVSGTRAGELHRIVIDPNQQMHAVARIEGRMRVFIRRDSIVSIRREFGVAGPAYIDISRGTGRELDWSYAVIAITPRSSPTEKLGELSDDLRGRIVSLVDEVHRGVVAFVAATDNIDTWTNQIEREVDAAIGSANSVEISGSFSARLITYRRLGEELEATLSDMRTLAFQLERISKDSHIAQILRETDATLAILEPTLRKLAGTAPSAAANASVTTEVLPSTLLQAQTTARELEQLLDQLRRHWLLGGPNTPTVPGGRRVPAIEVRP
jgi:phospholipid/cholesterol/gamma-HCH transport system substrate-binding protein